MSIYNIDSQNISKCFDSSGNILHNAFDVSGNNVFTGIDAVNVMTFNVQAWSGLNARTALIGGIFKDTSPIIVGLQECSNKGTGGYVPNTFAYGDVATGAATPTGVMSQIPLEEFTSHIFAVKGRELRGYSKCYITINGKRIAFFSVHTEYYNVINDGTYSIHVSQMSEIFNAVREEQSFILTGDFNVICKSKSDQAYADTIEQFASAGYNMANWTGDTGFVDTWFSGSSVSGSSQKYPCDNIITSKDIKIIEIEYNKAKLTAGGAIDHIPIVAKISINN